METATEQPFRNLPQGSRPKDPATTAYFNYAPNETWRPSVNLYEVPSAYLVCVDLAGVIREEIDVTVQDQVLRIRGTRAVPTPEEIAEPQRKRIRVHLMEIDHGNFSRDVELPEDVQRDRITATHRNGMLWIELPKK